MSPSKGGWLIRDKVKSLGEMNAVTAQAAWAIWTNRTRVYQTPQLVPPSQDFSAYCPALVSLLEDFWAHSHFCFHSDLYFQMNSTFCPWNALMESHWEWKIFDFVLLCESQESLRIHLVLHGAGGCSKPSWFTIFCVVSSFFFKEVLENMRITIGPIETSFLRMTWICTRHALLFFWLNVSSFKSEFL